MWASLPAGWCCSSWPRWRRPSCPRFPSRGQVPPVQESSWRKFQVGDHCRNEQGGDGATCGLGLWLGQVFPSYECYPGYLNMYDQALCSFSKRRGGVLLLGWISWHRGLSCPWWIPSIKSGTSISSIGLNWTSALQSLSLSFPTWGLGKYLQRYLWSSGALWPWELLFCRHLAGGAAWPEHESVRLQETLPCLRQEGELRQFPETRQHPQEQVWGSQEDLSRVRPGDIS